MKLEDAHRLYVYACNAYEAINGKNSLEGTPYLFDPLHPTVEDFLHAAQVYKYMVKRRWKFTQHTGPIVLDGEEIQLIY
ncbi:hypothetical protein [Veillonella caviae]|uniref:hypothetical protein n=1 Tax=Veillonella caviae TaxID=248316 RepID=UPI0023A7FFF4|nr:hypothetical protein [Veillonella caviae]MCI5709508.1 hypothetical protein [Veillonella caviae]